MKKALPLKPAKKAVPEPRTAANAISRMPRKVRDVVSHALEDGADWRKVATICREHGFPEVNAQNVTNYRKGAHQDWLRRQDRLDAIRRDSETTAEIVRYYAANGGSPAEAGLLAAAEILTGALKGMGPETLQILMADDPKAIFAVTRELSRVVGAVAQRAPAQADPAAAPAAEPGNKLSEEEKRQRVLDMVDEAMGLKK